MSDRPWVFAHRGGADALPEHTLAAYLRALDEGADGVECDVRLTRDGHLVCVHDPRLERTSNGSGRVSTKTLAELEELDFGSWHSSAAVEELGTDHTRLLTLDRLVGTLRARGGPVRLLIETKHPSRYGGEVERKLVATLRRYGLAEPAPGDPLHVTVMSFAAFALRRIRALAPALPTVYLMEIAAPFVRAGRLPFGARIAGPGIELVQTRPRLIPTLHAAGHSTYVWTVNAEEELDAVLEHGVAGIISDRPRFVLDGLSRRGL